MKVRFVLQICDNHIGFGSADIHMERWVEIPFVPQVGLTVTSGDWEAQVESMLYQEDVDVLNCYVEPWRPLKADSPRGPAGRVIEANDAIDRGWLPCKNGSVLVRKT